MTEAVPEGYKKLFDVISEVLHLYKFDQTDFKCSGLVSRVRMERKSGGFDFEIVHKGVRYYQVGNFKEWAKPQIDDMEKSEHEEMVKFNNLRKKNKATLDMMSMEDEVKVLNDRVNNKCSSAVGVGSGWAGICRSRRTRIRIAVEGAYTVLCKRLGKKPSADEVFCYLKDEDSTGYIVDSCVDKVIWEDTKGKSHECSFKSVSNILSKVHGEMANV